MTAAIVSEAEAVPQNWSWATASELGEIITGNTPSTKNEAYYGDEVPFFKPTDLDAGYWVVDSNQRLSAAGASKARLVPPNSVLVTCIGATIGKTGYAQVEGATNQQINSLIPHAPHIDSKYLYFVFTSYVLQRQIHDRSSSTTMPILSKSKFEKLEIPLAPLNEQHRIVEKIEELFTRLDAGVEALKHAQVQLKKYRQAVLNAAVTGELSREWREARAGELEPASELLERILEERREKSTGKKYKEPVPPAPPNLPELSSGWVWTNFDALTDKVTSGSRGWKKYLGSGSGIFVLVQNVRDGRLSLEEPTYVDAPETQEATRTRVERGDMLITIVGQAGVTALVKEPLDEAYVSQSIALVRPTKKVYGPYLEYYLRAPEWGRGFMESNEYGMGRGHLLLSHIRETPVALPPYSEQVVISEEVERRFSVIDQLEATIEDSLKRSESLRQSILKCAFSGKLVAQDPDDEPASALLERIRQERLTTEQKGKKRKPGKDDAAPEPSLFAETEG